MTEQLNIEAEQTIPRAKLLDLSLTQLIAGSLAAATAAALGSRLGVVGTITGAAVGSVISAVAASLYVTSMTRARHALKWQKPGTRPNRWSADDLARAPLGMPTAPSSVQNMPALPQSSVQNMPALPQSSVQNVSPRLGRRWLGSVAVVFALATAFLLGLQLASGADLTGTSIGTRPPAAQGDASPRDVTRAPDASPTGTPVPGTTAPATTQPEATVTAPPTGPTTPAPLGGTAPAEPTPSVGPTAPTQPGATSQPPAPVSPAPQAG